MWFQFAIIFLTFLFFFPQGFVSAVNNMRSFVPAIYDCTISVPKDKPSPTMLRILKGQSSVVSVAALQICYFLGPFFHSFQAFLFRFERSWCVDFSLFFSFEVLNIFWRKSLIYHFLYAPSFPDILLLTVKTLEFFCLTYELW